MIAARGRAARPALLRRPRADDALRPRGRGAAHVAVDAEQADPPAGGGDGRRAADPHEPQRRAHRVRAASSRRDCRRPCATWSSRSPRPARRATAAGRSDAVSARLHGQCEAQAPRVARVVVAAQLHVRAGQPAQHAEGELVRARGADLAGRLGAALAQPGVEDDEVVAVADPMNQRRGEAYTPAATPARSASSAPIAASIAGWPQRRPTTSWKCRPTVPAVSSAERPSSRSMTAARRSARARGAASPMPNSARLSSSRRSRTASPLTSPNSSPSARRRSTYAGHAPGELGEGSLAHVVRPPSHGCAPLVRVGRRYPTAAAGVRAP